MVKQERYKTAVQSIWKGRAAITVLEGVLNPANGRTEPTPRTLAEGVPCRLSYTTVKATEPSEGGAVAAQAVTLYTGPNLDIPEGSRVTVTQNGVTRDYERSGTPAVYTAHQEVPLQLFRGWA